MSYATVSDVEALNRSRTLGVGDNPSEKDVELYLELSASDINGLLAQKGYSIPIPTTATQAIAILRPINAKGALTLMEEASPSSPIKKEAREAYNAALKVIENAEDFLNSPKDVNRSKPRGPGITRPDFTASGNRPFFARDMREDGFEW